MLKGNVTWNKVQLLPIFWKPTFCITGVLQGSHLIAFGRKPPSVNFDSISIKFTYARRVHTSWSCTHTQVFTSSVSEQLNLNCSKGSSDSASGLSEDSRMCPERCQDLNIIIWPYNPTVNLKNTGFIILFLSSGMFVSISLLSDSWLWKMSWEGVPFLILSLESSQTRFVPVSTSFIIPIR